MFEVFRFAWFAVRTLFGVVLLILTLYGAMWVFVRIHSAAMGNSDPDAALRRVMSYNARGIRQERKAHAVPLAGTRDCGAARAVACERHHSTALSVRG